MADKLIKKYNSDFTIIGNKIFRDKRLSCKDLGLLIQLMSLPDDWSFSVKGIATIRNDGIESIRTGIKKLEEYGYVSRVQERKNGYFGSSIYYIYDDPNENEEWLKKPMNRELSPRVENPISENPITENPISENPITDNAISENPPLYKELNNKELNNICTCTEEKENNPVEEKKDDLKIYYDGLGLYLTQRQIEDVDSLRKAVQNNLLNSSQSDLYKYLKKIYDNEKEVFVDPTGSEIRNLYEFVSAVFKKGYEKRKKNLEKREKEIEDFRNKEADRLKKETEEAEERWRLQREILYDDSNNPVFDDVDPEEIINAEKRNRQFGTKRTKFFI